MPKGIPGKPIIKCGDCGERREHKAKGLCELCYARRHSRQYRLEYKEACLASKRCWRHNNPGKQKAIEQRHYKNHRSTILANHKLYHQENCAGIRARAAQWDKDNPHRRAAITQRRRARKRNLPDTLSTTQAEAKLSILPCFYCGSKEKLTLDHFVPLGAMNNLACGTTRANTVVACKSCNSKKHTALPEEFLSQLVLAGA